MTNADQSNFITWSGTRAPCLFHRIRP